MTGGPEQGINEHDPWINSAACGFDENKKQIVKYYGSTKYLWECIKVDTGTEGRLRGLL